MLLSLFTFQVFAQGKKYEGPEDPAGDRAALREGIMDGNQFSVAFRNYGQVGRRGMFDGAKWPKDSETGMQLFDQMTILIGAQVFTGPDSLPVFDEAQIASRTDLDTLWYVQAAWSFENMLDQNPEGDLTWGLHPVAGYISELSETPALSKDPLSWPPGGWPSRGFETKWPGEWNGRFGRGVRYAQLESYFVANDAQDQEYLQPRRRGVLPMYYPRPGVKIGDLNPNVTVQKGLPWGGLGIRVEVRGYQWENPQTRDVLFWEYNISNVSDYTIPRAGFGYFIDMGIGNFAGCGDDQDELGAFNKSHDMAYLWDANAIGCGGWPTGTVGFAFLESPGISSDGIDNDNDGLTDEARDNVATQIIGPTDGITNLSNFMAFYGYNSIDQLRDHWDADEDQDWKDGNDENGNGIYDNGELAFDDVGLDGVGPGELNYYGPDADGTECNHKPDLLEGLNSEPNFGLNDVSESDMLGLTSFHFHPWPGGDGINPKRDREFYEFFVLPDLELFTGAPADRAPVFGSGPVPLARGTTERFSSAMVGAFENVDHLNNNGKPFILLEKKKIIQLIYESDYRFAKPPEMPVLTATAQDGNIVLTWDDNSEKFTREPLLQGENDFEGYKLYKSTDRSFVDAQRVYDGFGNPSGKVPIFQCDLVNDIQGYTDFGILQGETYYLGQDSGIRHHYVDNDVENGRTYYYYLAAYDRGISGVDANIAPAENVASIIVDAEENIIWTSPNVQIVTPHQFAADYISPNLEITPAYGEIKGSGKQISFEGIISTELKEGHEYRLSFVVDSVSFFPRSKPFPDMGYIYRNTGFTVSDVTDSNRILIHQTEDDFWGQNIIWEPSGKFWYVNPNLSLDPLEGIKISWSDLPTSGPEYDPENTGWIVGHAPIQDSVQQNEYRFYPWQTDIVFTSGDITYTTKATDISAIRKVGGIDPFYKSLLLPGQTFDFYVENKQFQDSLGGNFLLDVLAYDADTSGTFDILEDDVLIGYSSMDDDEMKWQLTIATFNFKTAESAEELPAPGDVYRIESKRPFVHDDQFSIRVIEPSSEMKQNAEDLDKIKVVPNPYIVTNMMEPALRNIHLNQRRRLMFTHIPAQCNIKIFTISGYLVDEIEVTNEPSNGIVHWDLLTREGLEIAPGIYVYHLKSNNSGKEKMGKFAIIK